jgi:methionine aminopeptidase
MAIQSFGENFDLQKLFRARDVARNITYELSSLIRPGMIEEDAHRLYKELSQKYQVEKQWHPAKLRFGPNTTKSFREVSDPYVLKEEDLFFVDIGPVIEGHEADFGATFTLGNIYEQKHIADSSEKIFHEVGNFWMKNRPDGKVLYEFAEERASHYGYSLNMSSDGHRLGDFPHHVHFKGGLAEVDEVIVPNAWILEIHLSTKDKRFGAFFEDVLSDNIPQK